MKKAVFGAFVLMICAAGTAPADPTPLSISAGSWAATDDNGVFADTWSSGPKKLAFRLPSNSAHFMLQLSGFTPSIPDGTKLTLALAFDNGPTLQLPAQASQNMITVQIPDNEIAGLTHGLTADQTVLIRTPNWVWTVPLTGTTTTISALADVIAFAGIKGLPAPFDDPMNNPTSNPPPPITEAMSFTCDGYDFVIFDQDITIPDPSTDQGTDEIEQQLPQIINPVTPEAIIFNQNIRRFVETTWANSQGPKTINPNSHPPGTNITLVAGAGTSGNDWPQHLDDMLPGVISIRFEYIWGTAPMHPGTYVYDFNWLMANERPIVSNDIFDSNKNWHKAMIDDINARRGWVENYPAPDLSKQFVDPINWLLKQEGIELVFRQDVFSGQENGGATEGVVVTWSDFKPYLKMGGPISAIVTNTKP